MSGSFLFGDEVKNEVARWVTQAAQDPQPIQQTDVVQPTELQLIEERIRKGQETSGGWVPRFTQYPMTTDHPLIR